MKDPEEELKAGQIWEYKTRQDETASRVTILKVEKYEHAGVFAIALADLIDGLEQ